MIVGPAIQLLLDGHHLSREDAHELMGSIMDGEATPAQIAGFLVALRTKGETADEIAGFAEAMRGHVVPVTPLGRMVAALVMICGVGVFGLWTGILATGFAAETRRDNFLKTWESVTKVPFFATLGQAAIADVTHMLRTMDLPARTTASKCAPWG